MVAMDRLEIPYPTQNDLLARLAPQESDIVTGGPFKRPVAESSHTSSGQ